MPSARLDIGQMFHIQKLAGPFLVLLVLSMMILPLPAFVLDVFFTFNIATSITILLIALYTRAVLEFSVFPIVLLVTTLLRLSLNVASARVVLLNGHQGPQAAGHVIESFGKFLIGGNYTVGLVVFIILTVINFIVITKGAGRIAEVSARFALDAMPGKQMAIDADLSAGLIGEEEAKKRRITVSQEADFFGSMDGASKFVRGDAIAAIIILFINLVGGLIVGLVQHDLSFSNALHIYTLLTIGDGLVAQIPGLLISTAAGLVVSRVSNNEDIGSQLVQQVFSNVKVLVLTSLILLIMGALPHMPHFVFLLLAAIIGITAYYLHQEQTSGDIAPEGATEQKKGAADGYVSPEVGWNDVQPLDLIGLEVGYRLIVLIDQSRDGELLRRIKGVRRQFAQEVGYLVAQLHIRDNLELKPHAYTVFIRGVEIVSGEVYPHLLLAINPGHVTAPLTGQITVDPAFNLPAVWIEKDLQDQAKNAGYTVVDASTVIATHIKNIFMTYACDLLGRSEVQELLTHFAKSYPKLVEDVVPKLVSVSVLQQILHNLLNESIPIRDMRTILETLAAVAVHTQDADALTMSVRASLSRLIVQRVSPGQQDIFVMIVSKPLEEILSQTVTGKMHALEPNLMDALIQEIKTHVKKMGELNVTPILMVLAELRFMMARLLKRNVPQVCVIANTEIPEERKCRVVYVIGQQITPSS